MSEFPCFRKSLKSSCIVEFTSENEGTVVQEGEFKKVGYHSDYWIGCDHKDFWQPCEDPRPPTWPQFRRAKCINGKEYVVMFRSETSGVVVMTEKGCLYNIWHDKTDWLPIDHKKWTPCEDPRPSITQDVEKKEDPEWPKVVPHYRTSDGKVFETSGEAESHQVKIDLMAKFIQRCCEHREGMLVFNEDLESFIDFFDV